MTDKERIEVYVNELPEHCWDCPMMANYDDGDAEPYCVLNNAYLGDHDNCPLKTIQSVQNKRAIEALEKVKKIVNNAKGDFYRDVHIISAEFVIKKIYQLIKEYGEKDE